MIHPRIRKNDVGRLKKMQTQKDSKKCRLKKIVDKDFQP